MVEVRVESKPELGLVEKIGYALGDTASNFVFQILAIFALGYYTDTVGINPALIGVLLLIVRIVDAFTDPVMGRIADRTQTSMGRYRPWILWLAVPFGVSGVLTFAVPDTASTFEVAYVFVTYILVTLVYTAINIPYSALISSMTLDSDERQKIQSWRFVGGQLGALCVGMLTLPLVEALGGGAVGWRNTMIVYGVAAVIMFFICFAVTHERVGASDNDEYEGSGDHSVLEDLGRLWKNDQWRILCVINFILLTAIVLRVQMVSYVIRDALAIPLDLVDEHVSAYFTLGGVAAISASFIPNVVTGRFDWRKLFLPIGTQIGLTALTVALGFVPLQLGVQGCALVFVLLGISLLIGLRSGRVQLLTWMFAFHAAAQLGLFLVGGSSFVVSALMFAAAGFFNQVAVPILWTLMADSVDYGEVRTGHRLPALTFSTIIFALKAGIAMAGFLGGLLLATFGYQAPKIVGDFVLQNDSTIQGILITFALIPALITATLVWFAGRLKLSEAVMSDIHEDLNQRKLVGAV